MAKAKKVNIQKKTNTGVIKSTPVKSSTIGDLRKNCIHIGDSQYSLYIATEDLGHAAAALAGYKQAIDAAKTQLTYQKMSGRVTKVAFLEE